jgi:lipoate-protein ligase B
VQSAQSAVKIKSVNSLVEKTEKCALRIYDCGLADYREVLQQQHELQEKRRRGEIPDTILITEHPPTVTKCQQTAGQPR